MASGLVSASQVSFAGDIKGSFKPEQLTELGRHHKQTFVEAHTKYDSAQKEIIAHLFSSFAAAERETMTCFSSLARASPPLCRHTPPTLEHFFTAKMPSFQVDSGADPRVTKLCHRLILEVGAQKSTVLKVALDRLLRIARCQLQTSLQGLIENHEMRVRWIRETSACRLQKSREAARMELDASARLSRALLSGQQARLLAERCEEVEVLVDGYSAEVRACRISHARLSSEKEALCNSQIRLKDKIAEVEEELDQYRKAEAGQAVAVGEWHAENQKRVARIVELQDQLQDTFSQIEKLQLALRTKSHQVETTGHQLRVAEQDASSLQFRVEQLEHAVQAAKDAMQVSRSEVMRLNQHNARLVAETKSATAKCRVEAEVREGVERELGQSRKQTAAAREALDLSLVKVSALTERLGQCVIQKNRFENLARTREESMQEMKLAMIKSIKSQQELQLSIWKLKKQREMDKKTILAMSTVQGTQGSSQDPNRHGAAATGVNEPRQYRGDSLARLHGQMFVRRVTESESSQGTSRCVVADKDTAAGVSPALAHSTEDIGEALIGRKNDGVIDTIRTMTPRAMSGPNMGGDMNMLSKQLEEDLRGHLEAKLEHKVRVIMYICSPRIIFLSFFLRLFVLQFDTC